MKKTNCLKTLIILLPLYLIPLFFPSSVFAAKFYFEPADYETRKGKVFEIQVNLDTEEKKVSGIDLVIEYPKEIIWVDKVEWGEIFEEKFININIKGELSLSAAQEGDDQYFQGSGRLVTLTLSTHGQGTANLDFVCQEGSQDETNIIEFETGNDLVDCSRLRQGIYVIHEKDWWPGKEEEEEEGGCEGEAPSPPTNLEAVSGPESGEVTLTWDKASGADFYTISYGLISGNYIYGAPNIGDTNQYVVRGLTPGKAYYFVMTAVGECGSSGYSQEVWAQAGGAPVVAPTEEPEVVDYIPPEEPLEPEITASPSATLEPIFTPEPSSLTEEEEKKTKFPFWLKYLAIAAGAGLFLVFVFQEGLSAIKRRKPPEPPAPPTPTPPPPPAQPEPEEKPPIQPEEEPPAQQEPPFARPTDKSPKSFSSDLGQPPSNGGGNKTPWNSPR